jgi:DsbC/DsbD-like thiol-disulfide interchange protein
MHTAFAAAITLSLFCGQGFPAATAHAAATATGPHTQLRLISETSTLEPGRNLDLGFLFDLEAHWHIYWINPGDSGEPPSITWNLPQGFQAKDLEWPAPQRLVNGPLTDYGYQDRVLLIAPVRVPSLVKQQDVTLSAEVHWLVCSDVCIPAKAGVSVDLPVQRTTPHPDAQARDLFRATRHRLPQPLPAGWRVEAEDKGSTFRIRLSTGTKIRQASFFPLDFNQVENAKPQNAVPLATGVEVNVYKSDQLLKPIRQLRGVLVIDDGRAYQLAAPVTRG